MPVVRVAELGIDPTQLAAYTAVKEEMDTSVRAEPVVLAIPGSSSTPRPSN